MHRVLRCAAENFFLEGFFSYKTTSGTKSDSKTNSATILDSGTSLATTFAFFERDKTLLSKTCVQRPV